MMNGIDGLSANTMAILLLTAPLIVGKRGPRAQILTAGEYRKLAPRLASLQSEPADLLEPGADPLLAQCAQVIEETRLRALLGRGFLLSQAVERWQTRGIWVVSRADAAYPPRLKKRLKNDAPSVLYGCGLQEIMHTRSFAIVGSRSVTEPLVEYTSETASLVARAGLTVVSGGARGVDRAAMNGALEVDGRVVGVLPGDLEKTAMNREHRNLLLEDRLALVSPFDPSLRFTVAQAMQRNRVIYALAEAGLVVNADTNRGGTWAGAVEQLKKYSVPLFVRSAGNPCAGLEALRHHGARRWPEPRDADEIEAIIGPGTCLEGTSTDQVRRSGKPEASPLPSPDSADAVAQPKNYARLLFRDVETYVVRICAKPQKTEHVASELGVPKTVANIWLKRLSADGTVEKVGRETYVTRHQRDGTEPATILERTPSVRYLDSSYAERLFRRVHSYVQQICVEPKQRSVIANELEVSTTTLAPWLKRLVDDRTLDKRRSPVRYVVAPKEEDLPFEERSEGVRPVATRAGTP